MDLSEIISIQIGDYQISSIQIGEDVIWEPKRSSIVSGEEE